MPGAAADCCPTPGAACEPATGASNKASSKFRGAAAGGCEAEAVEYAGAASGTADGIGGTDRAASPNASVTDDRGAAGNAAEAGLGGGAGGTSLGGGGGKLI